MANHQHSPSGSGASGVTSEASQHNETDEEEAPRRGIPKERPPQSWTSQRWRAHQRHGPLDAYGEPLEQDYAPGISNTLLQQAHMATHRTTALLCGPTPSEPRSGRAARGPGLTSHAVSPLRTRRTVQEAVHMRPMAMPQAAHPAFPGGPRSSRSPLSLHRTLCMQLV